MLTNMFLVRYKVCTKKLHFDSFQSLFLNKFFTKNCSFLVSFNFFWSFQSFFQKKILENFTEKCSVENELSASYNSIIQSEALINLANPNVFGPIKRIQSCNIRLCHITYEAYNIASYVVKTNRLRLVEQI